MVQYTAIQKYIFLQIDFIQIYFRQLIIQLHTFTAYIKQWYLLLFVVKSRNIAGTEFFSSLKNKTSR